MQGIGLKELEGLNSGALSGGVAWCAVTINPDDQSRDSSQTSYLDRVIGRNGLKLYVNTLAKKILFNNRKTATGILVEAGENLYVIKARREVIVSAGAIQSPQVCSPL